MKTVVIQIGNSDNKLTQEEWSQYVYDIQCAINKIKVDQHFFGGPPTWERWQNVCWVFTVNSFDSFYSDVETIRTNYKQDSIAMTVGDTEFI